MGVERLVLFTIASIFKSGLTWLIWKHPPDESQHRKCTRLSGPQMSSLQQLPVTFLGSCKTKLVSKVWTELDIKLLSVYSSSSRVISSLFKVVPDYKSCEQDYALIHNGEKPQNLQLPSPLNHITQSLSSLCGWVWPTYDWNSCLFIATFLSQNIYPPLQCDATEAKSK